MPKLIFEGDWTPDEIDRHTTMFKSLGMDSASGLEAPTAIAPDFPKLISDRQRKLLEMMRSAGKAALEQEEDPCVDRAPEWDEYTLNKSAIGSVRSDPETGRLYRLNQHNRWESFRRDSGAFNTAEPAIALHPSLGEFGEGVYFQVGQSSGNAQLRVSIAAMPDQAIDQDEYDALVQDLSSNVDLILDSKGVKVVMKVDGETVTSLMVRDRSDISILGLLPNSGAVPDRITGYKLLSFQQRDKAIVADVELMGDTEALEKSAKSLRRKTLASATHLDGAKLVSVGGTVDRALVRSVIQQLKHDGVSFEHVRVSIIQGVPDFLPRSTSVFCIPADRTVYICPHDSQAGISRLVQQTGDRLSHAVAIGAVPADEALKLMVQLGKLTPEGWLSMVLTRCIGGVLAVDRSGIFLELDPQWQPYLRLLSGRGISYWGNRKAIAQVMAEDYRCAIDPTIPNLFTLEWDLACPAIARMCQQLLIKLVQEVKVENAD
jgi:hypothetical protein